MKKGFTLIELLAVIVILAIIALIATPIVLNIISDVKENSFKSTVDSVERAIELKISEEQLDGKIEYPYTLDIKELDLDNKENLNGKVIVNSKDDIVINVNDGVYYYYGEDMLNNNTYIKAKEVDGKGKNIIIDEQRKYIYGFDESWEYLTFYQEFEPIKYLEAVNGTIEIEPNEEYGTYSTGSKVLLKDNEDNIVDEYYIIIFGDVNGDMHIQSDDTYFHYKDVYYGLEHYQKYSLTGVKNYQWMEEFEGMEEYELNQFTRKLELIDWSLYE